MLTRKVLVNEFVHLSGEALEDEPGISGCPIDTRSTIYVRLAERSFPRPVPLGRRAVGWVEAEVGEWVRERISESRFGDVQAGERGEAAPGTAGARRRAADARPVR